MLKWKLSWFMILSLLEAKTTPSPSEESEKVVDYLPSPSSLLSWNNSEFLQNTLAYEDYEDDVIMLTNQEQSSYTIKRGEGIKLVFPLKNASSLRIALSPCSGNMKWTFSYRIPSFLQVEVVAAKPEIGTPSAGFMYKASSRQRFGVASLPRSLPRKRRGHIARLGKGRRVYNCTIVKRNFSGVMNDPPITSSYSKGRRSFQVVELSNGEGEDPWVYQNRLAQPALYIIRIEGLSSISKFDILATKDFFPLEDSSRKIKAYSKKGHVSQQSLTLAWRGRRIDESSACLAISRKKLYSSFCAAQEIRSKKITTDFIKDSMILGCTSDSQYTLPVTKGKRYFVSVWDSRSLIPFIQAIVEVKRRRKPQLRPGKMVSFTLNAGGTVKTKFHVRRPGRKLHVAAVSCFGGVEVDVLDGKKRVARAKGIEALHLMVKKVPTSKLIIKVSPESTSLTLYRVYLVVTHSARRLPIPRLPHDVTVGAEALNCTAALIDWGRSPGGATYCIALRTHPSGRPPEIRPPLQCGWEHAIAQKNYFDTLRCLPAQKPRRVTHVLTDLLPETHYLVNVLVRHPTTERILALSPAMLTLPPCSPNSNLLEGS